jgi:hypothetical protein
VGYNNAYYAFVMPANVLVLIISDFGKHQGTELDNGC